MTDACNKMVTDMSDACNNIVTNIVTNLPSMQAGTSSTSPSPSYAAVAASERSRLRVTRGSSIEVPRTTSFIVTPVESSLARYKLSKKTRVALQKVIKPSEYNLKVNRISSVKNNGVRIEALSVDLPKIKNSINLERAGLRLEQERKVNPRMLIRGVPCNMSREEIRSDLISLNLEKVDESQIRVVYIFPQKHNRLTTSCVIEVIPEACGFLLRDKSVYIGYFACGISDYVRVLQCYKCLAFGHFAKHCRFSSMCGHCAGSHETKDCSSRGADPTCGNCKRWLPLAEQQHSAFDEKIVLFYVEDWSTE
ncbi:uncharacterized protein LOC143901648 [Temnothorax americanus]|uniref:uncharacterized protein LOC143901648 n=1 Tax=Temnothorax americanus TaxID=1964332 RepID=UPI004068D5B7